MASDLRWINVDVNTLSLGNLKAYQAMKEAYRAYAQLKLAFEAGMQADYPLPAGRELKFGYNFGKLSVAVGEARDKPKATTPKQSLEQFLQQAANGGHRA